MTPVMIGILGILVLFIVLSLGASIGAALGIISAVGMWILVGPSATLLKMVTTPITLVSSYDLSVLPLFLLMAQICTTTGISRDLYDLASKWLGRFSGGVAMATIFACAMFAAMSGSAVACAATIGAIALPEMKRLGYSDELSTGVTATGGTLGIAFPPSFQFILYGILTGTSIGAMFMAGIIPGCLQALFYMVAVYAICKRHPELGPPAPPSTLREKMTALGKCAEIMALVVLVMGGIAVGWFTPTEAGSVGAGGAILFTLIRRRLHWANFKMACMNSMRTAGMVYTILVGAYLFTYFVTLTNLPTRTANMITDLHVHPMIVVWIIIGIYLILGTAMEEASMMLLTIPIFTPVIANLGMDKVWFGMICVRMMMVAMISPPVGITLFIVKGLAKDVPMTTIYKGVMPFIWADVANVLLIVFVPWVTLFLPNLMMK